jgi:hypothetical protein
MGSREARWPRAVAGREDDRPCLDRLHDCGPKRSFGWRYDFNVRELQAAEQIPEFLSDPREKAAQFASLSANQLQHALITEYSPGTAIGWHSGPAQAGFCGWLCARNARRCLPICRVQLRHCKPPSPHLGELTGLR